MTRRKMALIFEAEELLREISSWTDEDLEILPKLYREKAREYQTLLNLGET